MTAPQTDATTDLESIIALQQRLDAALAREATLVAELAVRTVARSSEYGERIEHQRATIDVLKVMSASPGNPQPVFELIVRRARELCNSQAAMIYEYDGELVHIRADDGAREVPGAADYFAAFPMKPIRGSFACRAILDEQIIHIRDVPAERERAEVVKGVGIGSALAIPLLRDGAAIGAFIIDSIELGGYSESQVALLETFAEQAVIAISSAETYLYAANSHRRPPGVARISDRNRRRAEGYQPLDVRSATRVGHAGRNCRPALRGRPSGDLPSRR